MTWIVRWVSTSNCCKVFVKRLHDGSCESVTLKRYYVPVVVFRPPSFPCTRERHWFCLFRPLSVTQESYRPRRLCLLPSYPREGEVPRCRLLTVLTIGSNPRLSSVDRRFVTSLFVYSLLVLTRWVRQILFCSQNIFYIGGNWSDLSLSWFYLCHFSTTFYFPPFVVSSKSSSRIKIFLKWLRFSSLF